MTEESTISQAGEEQRDPARREARDSMLLLTTICSIAGDVCSKARIRNLSANGLMAECDCALAAGTAVACELRGIGQVTGKIMWARDKRVGIMFDAPVDPALTRTTSKVASKATEPDMPLAPYLQDLNMPPLKPGRPGFSGPHFRKR